MAEDGGAIEALVIRFSKRGVPPPLGGVAMCSKCSRAVDGAFTHRGRRFILYVVNRALIQQVLDDEPSIRLRIPSLEAAAATAGESSGQGPLREVP